MNNLGLTVCSHQFSNPTLRTMICQAIIIAFGFLNYVPRGFEWSEYQLALLAAGVGLIIDVVRSFGWLRLLVKFPAGFGRQIGKSGYVDYAVQMLDDFVSVMCHAPIGKAGSKMRRTQCG